MFFLKKHRRAQNNYIKYVEKILKIYKILKKDTIDFGTHF